MADVIQFSKTDTDLNRYLRVDEPPFTMAKIAKFKSQEAADDFKSRPVTYMIKQVPGFRIFLIHAGFVTKPESHVFDYTIEKHMDAMIEWYAENKTSNKRERNYYQIK